MESHLYAYLLGVITVVMLWTFYQVFRILIERGDVSYRCPSCGEIIVSATRFDRITEIKYATHRVFNLCTQQSGNLHRTR